MKLPKYILRIGFQEFAVPDNSGVATLMNLLEQALPVRARLSERTVHLEYTKDKEATMLVHSTSVSVERLPPGTKFTRDAENGTVEILRPVPLADRKKPAAVKRPALKGREPLQLEFGR